ncbi:MAG: tRNA uridine-5-carboxymethylaminomethyl(34) synthesis enzyme MnmG [Bacilli bacterium]|nr:tRNA uridine-5-carboxymethylaminomethyl(34) synthesis enzyme MnmG [Bacilli bacterium]MBQ6538681.1 tRNA uridine-5-carboxymethylaminomethyl(34) synthesis enzyme MnmG [Bacilli bacterium]
MEYDIIVVGGGHAGCEAALSSARLGDKTLLVTGNIKNIADMPCNPSVGGPAKGIVVREIDALGGEMGKNADKACIQMKMLNTKKGPAVQALRAQADKHIYPLEMLKTLNSEENLTIKEAMVEDLIVEDNKIKGIILDNNEKITSKAVILTTGTYLKADILNGKDRTPSGPHGEKRSNHLSDKLKELGFTILRLKTGTPPRVDKNIIDYDKTSLEPGDNVLRTFSFDNKAYYKVEEQVPCHLIYTNEETHKIINKHLQESSMYGGYVEGIGPRYCPSIEDKVVRFSDKERHQLFLEPESNIEEDKDYGNTIYIQGFSTSMPYYVQDKLVHSLKGLENAKILKYAYAIEYDAIDSKQLKPSLETKLVENLFTAGQINGTSGYEEAAGQGLIAGINAHQKLHNKEPLILKRNEAYIGVLIDDLVTKGIKDPYRLLTSRAEYRLLLRNDNADIRLTEYGKEVGLITDKRYKLFKDKINSINELTDLLKETRITPKKDTIKLLEKLNTSSLNEGISLYEFLKRPEITINDLSNFIELNYSDDVKEEVEIIVKYEGYIKKANKEAEKMLSLESKGIPEDIDYNDVDNLASEAREKLIEIRPLSIGQASRISGVNPADISILMVYLRRKYNDR